MKRAVFGVGLGLIVPAIALADPLIPSTPDLGKAEGRCRPGETGPALLVNVAGDRKSTRLNSSHIQKSRMPSSA